MLLMQILAERIYSNNLVFLDTIFKFESFQDCTPILNKSWSSAVDFSTSNNKIRCLFLTCIKKLDK